MISTPRSRWRDALIGIVVGIVVACAVGGIIIAAFETSPVGVLLSCVFIGAAIGVTMAVLLRGARDDGAVQDRMDDRRERLEG